MTALAFLANHNYEPARVATDHIVNRTILFDSNNTLAIADLAFRRIEEDPLLKKRVMDLVRQLDFGIRDLTVEWIPASQDNVGNQSIPVPVNLQPMNITSTKVTTAHTVYNKQGKNAGSVQFNLFNHESSGTKTLIPFITMILEAMDNGWTVLVDELGSNFHPFITAEIVKLFLGAKHKAQLIALTHETYLLGDKVNIDRDSIWLVEKNKCEESNLTPLSEYEPREDARIQKQYLEGRFGAVPVILDRKL